VHKYLWVLMFISKAKTLVKVRFNYFTVPLLMLVLYKILLTIKVFLLLENF